jgi:hypothetical protein
MMAQDSEFFLSIGIIVSTTFLVQRVYSYKKCYSNSDVFIFILVAFMHKKETFSGDT